MNTLGQIGVRLLIVLALQSVFSAAKRPELVGLGIAAGLMLVGFLICSRPRIEKVVCVSLGFLTPLIAWVGPQLLLGVALLFFLMRPAAADEKGTSLLWAAPFTLYLVGGLLGELSHALDLSGMFSLGFLANAQVDGAARTVDVWRSLCGAYLHSIAFFSRALLFILAVTFFSNHREYSGSFLRGFLIGAGVSAAFTSVQWCGLLPMTLPNQTPFWTMIHRVGGLMTDPNALGVVMGLSVWCWALRFVQQRRKLAALDCGWLLIVCFAGTVAGSRTFLIFLVSFLLACMWMYRRRLFFWSAAAGIMIVAVVTLLDTYTPIAQIVQHSAVLPEGIKRGLMAISLVRAEDTFGSRSLFLDLARLLGSEHRVFGIGADRFREYVPLVGAQSGLVRAWTDNANNLYVGLLVELGVIGGLFFLLAVFSRTRAVDFRERGFAGWLLATLALVMCTGPHVDFIEVLLVVACLVGAVTSTLPISSGLARSASLIALAAGIVGSLGREHGVYPWSESPEEVKRWLSNRATVEVICESDPLTKAIEAHLTLQAMYVPTRGPLKVSVLESGKQRAEILFSSQERQTVSVPCKEVGGRSMLTVVTQPAWSPYRAWPSQSGDRRLLGVQQFVRRLGT